MPEMQETLVQFLGRDDPLEEEMATHSSILAWRIPWAEEPGRLQSMGVTKSWMLLSVHEVASLFTSMQCPPPSLSPKQVLTFYFRAVIIGLPPIHIT